MTEILILGEQANGDLNSLSKELLAAADSISDNISIAFLGNDNRSVAEDAIRNGASKVYLLQSKLINDWSVDARVAAYEHLLGKISPSVILLGKTQIGQDIGPRLACRLGVGLSQDSISIALDPKTMRPVATRPVLGGRMIAKVSFAEDGPNIIVIRKGSYDINKPNDNNEGDIQEITFHVEQSDKNIHHIQTILSDPGGVKLENAPVIVAGGRGLGGPEPFEMLSDLAKLLGGSVGASRAACDAGWIDHNYQIGLTGKNVSPALYITVGISGASQHMAGCSGAKFIVAINKDPDANIFKEASLGAVGDWEKILPPFISTVKDLLET